MQQISVRHHVVDANTANKATTDNSEAAATKPDSFKMGPANPMSRGAPPPPKVNKPAATQLTVTAAVV